MLQVIAYLDTGQQRRRTLNSMHVKLGIYPAASCFESKPFFSTQLQCLVLPSLQCCCIQHCSIGHPSSDSVSAVALSVRSTQHPDHTAWHLSMSDRRCAHTHKFVLAFRLWQDFGVCAAHQGQGRQSEREWAQTCHHLFGSQGLAGAAGMLACNDFHRLLNKSLA